MMERPITNENVNIKFIRKKDKKSGKPDGVCKILPCHKYISAYSLNYMYKSSGAPLCEYTFN